jgi:hypothetical protein
MACPVELPYAFLEERGDQVTKLSAGFSHSTALTAQVEVSSDSFWGEGLVCLV